MNNHYTLDIKKEDNLRFAKFVNRIKNILLEPGGKGNNEGGGQELREKHMNLEESIRLLHRQDYPR